ncbi:MAG: TlpA disulfide reductase family protein [Myxococcota bacterium]
MLPACGAAGARPGAPAAAEDPGLELALRGADGSWLHVGDLRGRPLLLFFFATYDPTSQAAFRPVTSFAEAHADDARVLGVAAQPDARAFLGAFEAAVAPPFPLAYDADDRVRSGESAVGALPGVPSFLMLDARGEIVGNHVGFPPREVLEVLLDAALARGGIEEERDVPLLSPSLR